MLNVRFESLACDPPLVDALEFLWASCDSVAPNREMIAAAMEEFRKEYSQRIGNRKFMYVGKLELAEPPDRSGVETLLTMLGVTQRDYAGTLKYGDSLTAVLYSVPRWPGYYVFVRGVRWGILPPTHSVAVFVFKDATKAAEPKP